MTQRVKAVEVFLEPHFTERNYILIPNSTTYHPDGRTHASSAIIMIKDVKLHELAKYETDHIQATNISIEDWNGSLTVSAIYEYCPLSPRN
jgi:hypothetical protein